MSVVEEVKKDLVGWKLGRVITVVDRGFTSEENLQYLQRAVAKTIAGEKLRSGKESCQKKPWPAPAGSKRCGTTLKYKGDRRR